MLPTRRTTSIAVILMLLVGSLACSLFSPAPTATPAPTPVAITVGPGATDTLAPPPPTDTAPAPPPTDTAPAPTPTTPPTAEPAGAVLLVVAAPDRSVGLVALDGQPHALSDAPEPLYALAALDPDPGAPARAYNFSSAGVFPLEFVQDTVVGSQGFAAYIGPAAPQGRLAWETHTVDPNGQGLISRLYVSSPDGSDARVVLEETNTEPLELRVWRWAPDGEHLYYSREPVGLGGYILFMGLSNLHVLNLADGATTQLIGDELGGLLCLDDLSAGADMAAHHCQEGQAGVLTLADDQTSLIQPPAEVPEFGVHGDVRLSPDGTRAAFALARRDPEDEQGWVAVSDGLSGGSRLVAASPANDYFQVKQWLDAETLLLQSAGAVPGVWTVRADGSDLRRLADGTLIGVMDGEPGM